MSDNIFKVYGRHEYFCDHKERSMFVANDGGLTRRALV